MRTFKTTPKTGELMAARMVDPNHELMLISEEGIVLRTPIAHISKQLRSTQGVTLMDVEGDRVAAVAVIDMQREYDTPDGLPTGATVGAVNGDEKPQEDVSPENAGRSKTSRKAPAGDGARPEASAGPDQPQGDGRSSEEPPEAKSK